MERAPLFVRVMHYLFGGLEELERLERFPEQDRSPQLAPARIRTQDYRHDSDPTGYLLSRRGPR